MATARVGRAALVAAALLVVAAPAAHGGGRFTAGRAARRDAASGLERSVLVQINAVRRGHGLRALRPSPPLSAAAAQHSTEMASRGYFSHSSADGERFDNRIARFYALGSRRYWSVGENLLWSSPSVDGAGALRMWMNSPEHRKILLTARWREVGVSAVHVAAAPGAYRGLEVTIVTADFGVRS